MGEDTAMTERLMSGMGGSFCLTFSLFVGGGV